MCVRVCDRERERSYNVLHIGIRTWDLALLSKGVLRCCFFFFFGRCRDLSSWTEVNLAPCSGSAESSPLDRQGSPYIPHIFDSLIVRSC